VSEAVQVLSDRPWGNLDTDLDEKLVRDPFLAPQRVVAMHLSDQIPQTGWQLWPAEGVTLRAPEESRKIALPADQSRGRDGDERGPPRKHTRQERERDPFAVRERRCSDADAGIRSARDHAQVR